MSAAAVRGRLRPRFLDCDGRRLFVVHHVPAAGAARGRVLVLPPLFEEMNRCRRLLALCCQRLSAAGFDVVLADLSGTGDSAGDFANARWDAWLDDLRCVRDWLQGLAEGAEEWLLAVRGGALMLPQLVADRTPHGLVAWQPVVNGDTLLQQTLRVRVMASRFAGGDESVKGLLQAFDAGEAVEVAGYAIAADLARALREARCDELVLPDRCPVRLLECKPGGGEVTVPVQKLAGRLAQSGSSPSATVLDCEQFWASQEISAPLAVVEHTVRALAGAAEACT